MLSILINSLFVVTRQIRLSHSPSTMWVVFKERCNKWVKGEHLGSLCRSQAYNGSFTRCLIASFNRGQCARGPDRCVRRHKSLLQVEQTQGTGSIVVFKNHCSQSTWSALYRGISSLLRDVHLLPAHLLPAQLQRLPILRIVGGPIEALHSNSFERAFLWCILCISFICNVFFFLATFFYSIRAFLCSSFSTTIFTVRCLAKSSSPPLMLSWCRLVSV